MKSLTQHISEKLVLNSNSKIRKREYDYHPTTKEELVEIIKAEVEKNGWECSLNHIDVSQIHDMSRLFSAHIIKGFKLGEFNGDISEWDVSNVFDMSSMFSEAYSFNQPIGDWDVSKVKDMQHMFQSAKSFNQPISDWDVSNVEDMHDMFYRSKSFNQDLSNWNINKKCNTNEMFYYCDIKEEYKPKFNK